MCHIAWLDTGPVSGSEGIGTGPVSGSADTGPVSGRVWGLALDLFQAVLTLDLFQAVWGLALDLFQAV